MNPDQRKQAVTLALAIGLGFVAVALGSQYVKRSIEKQTAILAQEYDVKTKQIVGDMQLMQKDLVAIKTNQQALAQRTQELQQLKVALEKGELGIGAGETVSPTTPFSVQTPPGKRAFTVLIDSLSAVGGLVKPGDFVDIIAFLDVPKTSLEDNKEKKQVISVIFQNIQVLAVGTHYTPTADAVTYDQQQKARSLNITVALDPKEASLLAFAQTNGKMQFALRPPTDKDTKTLEVASWEALSQYVLEKQGTELLVPKAKPVQTEEVGKEKEEQPEEVKPFIQIFKSGQESSL